VVKSLRRPPIRGSADPDMPGHVLVPVDKGVPGLPKVNYSVPATSFFRVDQRSNRPVAIVTVTPDGLPVAWDTCGQCGTTIRNCACHGGISCPNSVTHIYVVRGGIKPERVPLAVPFQAPGQLQPVNVPQRPRKMLKRTSRVSADEQTADAMVSTAFRKLKRRK